MVYIERKEVNTMYNAFQLKRILSHCNIQTATDCMNVLDKCGYHCQYWYNKQKRFWSIYLETERGLLLICYRTWSIDITATH